MKAIHIYFKDKTDTLSALYSYCSNAQELIGHKNRQRVFYILSYILRTQILSCNSKNYFSYCTYVYICYKIENDKIVGYTSKINFLKYTTHYKFYISILCNRSLKLFPPFQWKLYLLINISPISINFPSASLL